MDTDSFMEPGMDGSGAYILGVRMKLNKIIGLDLFIDLAVFMWVLCKVALGRVLCDMVC